MQIILLAEDRLRLQGTDGPLTIEGASPETGYSPFHMLGSALVTCVFSVLHSWASNARVAADGLAIEVSWTFAEKPHRVGSFDLRVEWPGLPAERRAAAERAAALCAVHNTLTHPPAITVQMRS